MKRNQLLKKEKRALRTHVLFLSVLLIIYCTYINLSAVYFDTLHFFDNELNVFVIPDLSVFFILFGCTFAFLAYTVFVKKAPILQGNPLKTLIMATIALFLLLFPLQSVTNGVLEVLSDDIFPNQLHEPHLTGTSLFVFLQAQLFLGSTVVLGFFVMLLSFAVIPFHFILSFFQKEKN